MLLKVYQKSYQYARTPNSEEFKAFSWDGRKKKRFYFKNYDDLVIGKYKKYKFKLFKSPEDGAWRYLIESPSGKTFISDAAWFSKKEAFRETIRCIIYLKKGNSCGNAAHQSWYDFASNQRWHMIGDGNSEINDSL